MIVEENFNKGEVTLTFSRGEVVALITNLGLGISINRANGPDHIQYEVDKDEKLMNELTKLI